MPTPLHEFGAAPVTNSPKLADRFLALADKLGNSVPPWLMGVLLAAAVAVAILVPGCAAPAVSVVQVDGTGVIRTDGDHVLVGGDVDGSIQVFAKGSGFPLFYVPFAAGDGLVFVAVMSDGTAELVTIDQMPAWTVDLFEPAPD